MMSQRNVCTECCVKREQAQPANSIIKMEGIKKNKNIYILIYFAEAN